MGIEAQDYGLQWRHAATYERALEEVMTQGHVRSCWIWYVFPVLQTEEDKGTMNERYCLKDANEAKEFFQHKLLWERYMTIAKAVLHQLEPLHGHVSGRSLTTLVPFKVYARKLHRSIKLFSLVAAEPELAALVL